jgi:hypothetical protein
MTSDHPRAGLHRATGFGGLPRRKDSPPIMVAFAQSQIPLPRGDQSMDTRSRLVMRGSGSGANLGARLLRPIRTLLGGLARDLAAPWGAQTIARGRRWTPGRELRITRSSSSSQNDSFHARTADPIASRYNAVVVSVALVLACSPSGPARRLRSWRTARTPVNSGEGDLESGLTDGRHDSRRLST